MSKYVSFGKVYMENFLREQDSVSPHPKTLNKRGKTYTMEDLEENKREYEENFRLLLRAIKVYGLNSPQHDNYIKLERSLNRKNIAIRGDLGVLAESPPCSHPNKECFFCDKEDCALKNV